MMNIQTKQSKNRGFTIVELMLATSVFSIVLLVALGSFLQVGRSFYKGVSLTATQNIATQVVNDISGNLQTSSSLPSLGLSSGGYNYFCINGTRYTYSSHTYSSKTVSNIANLSASPQSYASGPSGTFGLLKDTLPGSAGCSAPCVSACAAPLTNATEMLGDQMRLASISITSTPSAANVYNIKVVVAYGSDSVLSFNNPAQPFCVGNSQNQAFCSVITTSTAVLKGAQT